jgi:hypothetical protein
MIPYELEKDREFGYLRATPKPGMTTAARRELASQHRRSHGAVLDVLEDLLGSLSGRTLLDIGCKDGDFLDLCRARGINGAGWENVSNWVRSAALKGFHVRTADLDNALQDPTRRYSVVTIFDVLQFLEQPARALHRIRKNLLSDRGLLAVSVPNFTSLPDDLEAREPANESPAPISNYFNTESLTDLLEGCGFAVVGASPSSASMALEGEIVMFAKPDAYSKPCRATVVKNWSK